MVEVCAEAREKDYDAGFQPVIAAVDCNRKKVAGGPGENIAGRKIPPSTSFWRSSRKRRADSSGFGYREGGLLVSKPKLLRGKPACLDWVSCLGAERSTPEFLSSNDLRQDRSHGFHIFRHPAGSIVHTATGDSRLIQEYLGHSRISKTSDIYVHVPETMTGQATEIMVKEINLALSLPEEPELVN